MTAVGHQAAPGHFLEWSPMSEDSVAELLVRAAEGDRRAWDAIVSRYERLVWSVVRGFPFDDGTRHDVFQTVWLRLVEHCGRIREPERLAGWLATTARNEAIRALQQRRREVPSEFRFDLPDRVNPEAADVLIEGESERAVFRAFAELPEDCRHLLRLVCADPPLDYRTIAELVGRPVGSIGPTFGRCIKRMRQIMERHRGLKPSNGGSR